MMNPELQRISLVAFSFGSAVATHPPTDPLVVRAISRIAYLDLNRTLHGIATHPEAKALRMTTDKSIADFVSHVAEAETLEGFDRVHDNWCHQVVERYTASPHPTRTFAFYYGQAQKWLNMTLKYLAVLGHPSVSTVYAFLHVPVDQVIYDQAKQIGIPRPGVAWSRLGREHYLGYQAKLRAGISTASGGTLVPLDWEAQVWAARAPMPTN